MKKVDENNSPRRRARRALDEGEVAALLAAAPPDSRLKYSFALFAGIRRGEFRKLRWGDLRLSVPRPFIKLRPDLTKNKKADALPLHPYLVKLLGDLPAEPGDRRADTPVVASVPDMKTVAKDLVEAGIASEAIAPAPGCIRLANGRYVQLADKHGQRIDYHALRHTYSASLDRTGCSWVTKPALMRHSFAGVTEGYSHAGLEELFASIERLPSPLPTPTKADAGAKTGTDDQPIDTGNALQARQIAGGGRRAVAGIGAASSGAGRASQPPNTPTPPTTVGGGWRGVAGDDLNEGGTATIVRKSGPSTQVD